MSQSNFSTLLIYQNPWNYSFYFDEPFIGEFDNFTLQSNFNCDSFCITYQIILATRSRSRAIGQSLTFIQVETQKENYLPPIIIALSALPQAILTLRLVNTHVWNLFFLLKSFMQNIIFKRRRIKIPIKYDE